MEGGRIAFAVSEAMQRRDLNGDGDTGDDVLHVYDFAADRLVNVGAAVDHGPGFGFDGSHVVFQDAERGSLQVYDVAAGQAVDIGYSVTSFTLVDGWVVFGVFEPDGVDLNDNGESSDEVLHLYDIGAAHTVNAGLALRILWSGIASDGGRVAVPVPEGDQGRDLNADGDLKTTYCIGSTVAPRPRSTSVLRCPISRFSRTLVPKRSGSRSLSMSRTRRALTSTGMETPKMRWCTSTSPQPVRC